jgi:hypothetical protein
MRFDRPPDAREILTQHAPKRPPHSRRWRVYTPRRFADLPNSARPHRVETGEPLGTLGESSGASRMITHS